METAFKLGRDEIAATELLSAIDAGMAPVILDVRSRMEYAAGHIPGAVHIPFWTLPARIDDVPRPRRGDDAPIVVYCGHGPRAWMAGAVLRRRGFRRIIYLAGHWAAWKRSGLRETSSTAGADRSAPRGSAEKR